MVGNICIYPGDEIAYLLKQSQNKNNVTIQHFIEFSLIKAKVQILFWEDVRFRNY